MYRRRSRKRSKRQFRRRSPAIRRRMPRANVLAARGARSRMVYADFVQSTSAQSPTSAPVEKAWNLAGLYDPDAAIGGHQPKGYDQMTLFYRRWAVMQCELQLTLTNITNGSAYIVVAPKTEAFAVTSLSDAMELPGGRLFSLTEADTAAAQRTVRMKWNIPRLQGVTMSEYLGNEEFHGQAGNNPPRLCEVAIYHFSGDSTSSIVRIAYKLIYKSWHFDRVKLAQS